MSPAQIDVEDLRFELYISASDIARRINELSEEIGSKYKNKKPVFIAVLNGSFVFAADFFKIYPHPCQIEFVKFKSYHGTESNQAPELLLSGLNESDIAERPVIILEDIVDTGYTLTAFMRLLSTYHPESLAVLSLLVKPEKLRFDLKIDYAGFNISNEFVVGYGMDYNGYGRNIPAIYRKYE